MAVVTCDLETYYDTDYSLRRMSETDYILDPRYQTILCAVKVDDAPTEIHVGHDAVARRLNAIDWTRSAFLAHNTRFDGAIAAWRYGVRPALYLDTLGMARATTHAVLGRSSLAKVSDYLGLPPKGDEVVRMLGVTLEELRTRPNELEAYAEYCKRDADNCYAIFRRMRAFFGASELRLIDLVLRMFIEPQVRLNPTALAEHLGTVRANKSDIMARVAGIDPSIFSSNAKFAALLESHGVEVPRKISPATGEETWALAKNDRAFKELCDDDTQSLEVQALLAARVNAKSTLEETRTESLLKLSLRQWPGGTTGWAPVPLKYYGAHTGRLSGDGGYNWQNFKRGSPIRGAAEAPEGYRIVHRDASQIEARMVAWLAKCWDLLTAFERGDDIYSIFASKVYGERVTKAEKTKRFVGKTCLAAGTRLLTNRGVVVIEDVTTDHLLWDGLQWVRHDGLIANGQRETLTLCGVHLTPDHRVWCGNGWKEAQYLARERNGRSLKSALAAARSPSPDTWSGNAEVSNRFSRCATAARRNTLSTLATFVRSAAPGATRARKLLLARSATGFTRKRCPMTTTGRGCSTDSVLPSPGATLLPRSSLNTMASAVSRCALSGARIARRSSRMCRPLKDGTTPLGRWIASTTRRGMSQGTSGSRPGHRTCPTVDVSQISNSASENWRNVYDIANAGPRHRFTIITDAGPLIVANCILGLGYGMGAERFQHTLFIGNGGMSVRVDLEEARRIVHLYRSEYREIPLLWEIAAGMLPAMVAAPRPRGNHHTQSTWDLATIEAITVGTEALWLPNGLCIAYPGLEQRRDPNDPRRREWSYADPYGARKKLFGGKVTENISQALARIVVTDIAVRVHAETGYHPWLSTHDSLDYCIPVSEVAAFDALLARQFTLRPGWAKELPLASEGGWGRTLLIAESEGHEEHNQ